MEHRPHIQRIPYFMRSSHEGFKSISQKSFQAVDSEKYYLSKVSSIAFLNQGSPEEEQGIKCNCYYVVPPIKGTAHNQLLHIGSNCLSKDLLKHVEDCNDSIDRNADSWKYVLQLHIPDISLKVDDIFNDILTTKAEIIDEEASKFYNDTMHELEEKIKQQIKNITESVYGFIVSKTQDQITKKMYEEKKKLLGVLKNRYKNELKKIDKYYKLLLINETNRVTSLINYEKRKRNYIIEVMQRQFEAEKLTSNMYVMSIQRRKCKIKQMLLQNSFKNEATECLNKISGKQQELTDFMENAILQSDTTRCHEKEKTNIYKLFNKLISFSLKLLPEQANFFHNFKMLFLTQMHEFQTNPILPKQVLVTDNLLNKFQWPILTCYESSSCPEPFAIDGDLLPSKSPPKIDSRTTLPDDVDLPFMRVNRQFVYAKCDTFDEVKKLVEKRKAESSLECKCHDSFIDQPTKRSFSDPQVTSAPIEALPAYPCPSVNFESDKITDKLSSLDLNRLEECPLFCDKILRKHLSFPLLTQYIDYDEEKYIKVQTYLKDATEDQAQIAWIDLENVLGHEPYKATTERSHDVSVQTPFSAECIRCPCNMDFQEEIEKRLETNDIQEIMVKRKNSLSRLFNKNSHLFNLILNDESYNFLK